MRYIFLFLIASCFNYRAAKGQSTPLKVYGKVVNAFSNAPVAGATVRFSESRIVTATGKNGEFALASRFIRDTLYISGAEYEPLVLPVNNTIHLPLTIKIRPSSKALEDVVINTGYQTIPRERSTGSFTTISKELLNQQAGSNVLDRLEAISNALYFDRSTNKGSTNIVIRGLSTIQGPRAPLIILNDFPYEGDPLNINPNDVENITILKDAAAASIWGTRAGNGVIVITTKKGRFEQPIKIQFSSNVRITDKPDLFLLKQMSSKDFIDVERFLYSNHYYDDQLNYEPWTGVSPVVELLVQRDLGNITADAAEAGISSLENHDLRNDFNKYVYKTGLSLQQALSASGGNKNMAWNLFGGWDNNTGTLSEKYNRVNFRTSQTFKITPAIQLSTGLDYTQSVTTTGKSGYLETRPQQGKLPVYTFLADDKGNALPVLYQYRQAYTDTAGAGKLMDWNWYPLKDYKNITNTSHIQSVYANAGLDYKVSKDLSFTVKYQYGRQVTNGKVLYGIGSYFTRNIINTYTVLNSPSGQPVYNVPLGAIFDNENEVLETRNVRGQINFNKQWHHQELNFLAGSEYRKIEGSYSGNRTYGYDPDILTNGIVDYLTRFPNYLSHSQSQIPTADGFGETTNINISFYTNAAYTLKNKYTFSGSARRDASNLFGATPNNRWQPLWSAGFSWNINNENFYHLKKIPLLKLRLTYGVSGNADPSRSAYTILSYNSVSYYTQLPIARLAQFANSTLSWEKVKMLNAGVDFSLFKSRLQGSAEFYYKNGVNLFGPTPVDYTSIPTDVIVKNVASISGHGYDISLYSKNIMGNFSWSSQLNLNFNKDKVLKYYQLNKQGSFFTNGNFYSAIEGKPVYALYDYKWAGLDPTTGNPQGYYEQKVSKNYSDLTGPNTLITDMQYIGPTLPTAIASLGNTISWKNFTLTARVTGKFGYWFQRLSVNYTDLFQNRITNPDYTLRWQQPGDELNTNVPSMIYPANRKRDAFYTYSEVLATRADHIRFQYITLTYNFRRPDIQLDVNINNVGIVWRANKYGIDPEYYNSLSPSKTITIGFKASF